MTEVISPGGSAGIVVGDIISGPKRRGAVIVPAYNESAVIARSLQPLGQAACEGYIELVVVCNGCTDNTADVARSIPGAVVLELYEGSKCAALNAGDATASLWPRIYLDADIRISVATLLATLDRLREGDVLAARPEVIHDTNGASAPIRSYYRACNRLERRKAVLFGAGVYGLTEEAHQRFGEFPDLINDDLFVDSLFAADEKVRVGGQPVVVTTPADARSLLKIMRRGHLGEIQLAGLRLRHNPTTGLRTAFAVLRTGRNARDAVDGIVYLLFALMRRFGHDRSVRWARDDSSRGER